MEKFWWICRQSPISPTHFVLYICLHIYNYVCHPMKWKHNSKWSYNIIAICFETNLGYIHIYLIQRYIWRDIDIAHLWVIVCACILYYSWRSRVTVASSQPASASVITITAHISIQIWHQFVVPGVIYKIAYSCS